MAGREPTIIGTNRLVFNHDTLKQIVEHFINNNLFKGGAVNQVQVDEISQTRHTVEGSEETEKRFTVEYRNFDEVKDG